VFPIAKAYVEQVVLVDDADIEHAQHVLWNLARTVAEPGGAAACAALISGAYKPSRGERVAVIVSGGNTTAVGFAKPSCVGGVTSPSGVDKWFGSGGHGA